MTSKYTHQILLLSFLCLQSIFCMENMPPEMFVEIFTRMSKQSDIFSRVACTSSYMHRTTQNYLWAKESKPLIPVYYSAENRAAVEKLLASPYPIQHSLNIKIMPTTSKDAILKLFSTKNITRHNIQGIDISHFPSMEITDIVELAGKRLGKKIRVLNLKGSPRIIYSKVSWKNFSNLETIHLSHRDKQNLLTTISAQVGSKIKKLVLDDQRVMTEKQWSSFPWKKHLPCLEELAVARTKITEKALKNLAEVKIKSLSLENCINVTQKVCESLAWKKLFPGLTVLKCESAGPKFITKIGRQLGHQIKALHITYTQKEELSSVPWELFTKLEELYLHRAFLGSGTFRNVTIGLGSSLRKLTLSSCYGVYERWNSHEWQPFKKLSVINLLNCHITPRGLENMLNSIGHNLSEIKLNGAYSISTKMWNQVPWGKKLPNLQVLDIRRTLANKDAAINIAEQIGENLTHLYIGDTILMESFDPEIKQIRNQLPYCKVNHRSWNEIIKN